jgi:hypothetical protein
MAETTEQTGREESGLSLTDRMQHVMFDLQDAGYTDTEIIDAFLSWAGHMIQGATYGLDTFLASKDDLRRIVSAFSLQCDRLIEPPRTRRLDCH